MSDNPEETAYYLRLIRMYIDLGTETVVKVFYHLTPKQNVQSFFNSPEIRSALKTLYKNKILSCKEYKLVSYNPNPDNFDISLLVTLLTNLYNGKLPAPKKGWKSTPDSRDFSIAADLLRLRTIRNTIVAHQPRARLFKVQFDNLWKRVEDILLRLIREVDSASEIILTERIAEYKDKPLDPQNDGEQEYLEKLRDWCENCEEISKLQEQVESLEKKTQEFVLFFKSKPERYFRYIQLLFDGGRLVLSGQLVSEVSKQTETLEMILGRNQDFLKDKFSSEQMYKQLFQGTEEIIVINTNIKTWDITALAIVIINIFSESIDEVTLTNVSSIMEARNDYANTALMALDSDLFTSCCEDLLSSIRVLSSRLGNDIYEKCNEVIEVYKKKSESNSCGLDHYFQQLRSHGSEIKTIAEVYKETVDKLKDSVKKMEEDGIAFKRDHVLELKMVTLGNNKEKKKVAEDTLETVWQAALKTSKNPQEFEAVRQALDMILNDIRRIPDVKAEQIERHCILLSLRCFSWRGLLLLIEYFNSSNFERHLKRIADELYFLYDDVLVIPGNLTAESILAVLRNLECPHDEPQQFISVPIQCTSAEGMRQVLDILGKEKTINSFNEIAESLSEQVGDKIFVSVSCDGRGFSDVFEEEESEHSISSSFGDVDDDVVSPLQPSVIPVNIPHNMSKNELPHPDRPGLSTDNQQMIQPGKDDLELYLEKRLFERCKDDLESVQASSKFQGLHDLCKMSDDLPPTKKQRCSEEFRFVDDTRNDEKEKHLDNDMCNEVPKKTEPVRKKYSTKLQRLAIARVLTGAKIASVSKDMDIPPSTIRTWLKKAKLPATGSSTESTATVPLNEEKKKEEYMLTESMTHTNVLGFKYPEGSKSATEMAKKQMDRKKDVRANSSSKNENNTTSADGNEDINATARSSSSADPYFVDDTRNDEKEKHIDNDMCNEVPKMTEPDRKKYSTELQHLAIARVLTGAKIATVSKDMDIPRSTISTWLKKAKPPATDSIENRSETVIAAKHSYPVLLGENHGKTEFNALVENLEGNLCAVKESISPSRTESTATASLIEEKKKEEYMLTESMTHTNILRFKNPEGSKSDTEMAKKQMDRKKDVSANSSSKNENNTTSADGNEDENETVRSSSSADPYFVDDTRNDEKEKHIDNDMCNEVPKKTEPDRKKYSTEQQHLAIALVLTGAKIATVSKDMDIPRSTIRTWLKKAKPPTADGNENRSETVIAAKHSYPVLLGENNEMTELIAPDRNPYVTLDSISPSRIATTPTNKEKKKEYLLTESMTYTNDFEYLRNSLAKNANNVGAAGRRRTRYTLEEKTIALKRVKEGETISSVGKHLGIPFSTISDWRRNREFQASQGGECFESIAGDHFEPSENALDNTEVYTGKRKYPDTDGSDNRITRPRTRESENHLVTTLSFGGFNLERCPTKRNSHKKTFPSPRSSRKTSPRRTVSKRSVESTRDISHDELSDIDGLSDIDELSDIDIGKKIINLYIEKKADPDKKPDEEELEKILTEMDQVLRETLPDETDEKKVFQHKASQTVPTVVKFAGPNEVKLLKLCPSEQRQALLLKTRELDELRRNILTLMKILEPDYEYGPPENVDKVIKVLIKANNEQKNAS